VSISGEVIVRQSWISRPAKAGLQRRFKHTRHLPFSARCALRGRAGLLSSAPGGAE